MTPDECRFLSTLAEPNPQWQGLGSLKLTPDQRDYPMTLLPGVADLVEAWDLPPVDFSAQVQQIMNQGSEPSCVAFSTCGLTSTEDFMGDHSWDALDGRLLYREMGGDGRSGVDSRATLVRVRNLGAPLQSGAGRIRIGSYVFATQETGQFRREIAAAVSLGHFCTIALLLPSNWGWDSSGGVTSGYHQVYCVGFTGLADNDYAIVCNSWGASWGKAGFGRVTWGYLEANNLQQQYCYAFAVTPLVLPKPDPQPTPTPTPDPPPPPPPPPVDLRIDSVVGMTQAAGSAPGETFRVMGQGFGAGVVQARIGSQGCTVSVQSDGLLVVTAPPVSGCGPLFVRREGVEVQGPLVVVTGKEQPVPTPEPVGDLVIAAATQRLSAARITVKASVSRDGRPVVATLIASIGSVRIAQRRANGAATFVLNALAGTKLELDATDGTGRAGHLTVGL